MASQSPTNPDRPQVTYQGTDQTNSLRRVAQVCMERQLPIRMRVLIQLWDYEQYVAWKGTTWRVEAKDEGEAIGIKDALEVFFDVLAARGPVETAAMMAGLMPVRGQETDDVRPPEYAEPSQ